MENRCHRHLSTSATTRVRSPIPIPTSPGSWPRSPGTKTCGHAEPPASACRTTTPGGGTTSHPCPRESPRSAPAPAHTPVIPSTTAWRICTRPATTPWASTRTPTTVSPPGSTIAIVSLGATRRLVFRSLDRDHRHELALAHGSLLLMTAVTQRGWTHAVPRHPSAGRRVSLTFRHFEPHLPTNTWRAAASDRRHAGPYAVGGRPRRFLNAAVKAAGFS
ncbi:alpha-ketoglutarate-dependent dioxygenase AlkB [Embleya sp. NPDC020630]|uniref:alpha-ketoglutarate-dependent dioxygenase AlkB n=1 Tax=Embleya sp. NPDC020630 TaxID=3363979 RepID=UPI00378E9F0A